MRRLLFRIANLFRPNRAEANLAREVASHLALLEDEFRRRGMTIEDARLAAKRAFGGEALAKDLHRDARSFVWIDDARRDLQYAMRTLRRTPGFTAVAILTLALGIGANTAIFSLLSSLVLRALPVWKPERLVTLADGTQVDQRWTYGIWNQVRQRAGLFDGAFAWSAQTLMLGQGDASEPVDGVFASGDYFTALGVRALAGRTFTPADDLRGGGPDGAVAVISQGFWQRRFGGAASAIGARIVVEHVPFTIVGVTPASFFGAEVGRAFEIAVPIGTEPLMHGQYSLLDQPGFWLTVMMRLKPGQSVDAGTAALRVQQRQIREAAMPTSIAPGFRFLEDPFVLVPAAAGTSQLRQRYLRPLVAILVLVALVLLIACLNLATLLLARGTARGRECAVRLALGASRWRLVRQQLVESLMLAGAGAVAGLLVAAWGSRALVAQLSDSVDRVFLNLSPDWRVAAFAGIVTITTAALCGFAPAWRATRAAPMVALKSRAIASRSGRGGLPGGLIVGQVALALMLVVMAGLFLRTFDQLTNLPLGFDSERLLVVRVDATRAHVSPAERTLFYDRLVSAVITVPGVAAAAVSMITPISGADMIERIEVPGVSPLQERTARINYVTPGWFATYATAVRAGRDIEKQDQRSTPRVFVVNDAFARAFLAGREPVGATVTNPVLERGQARIVKTVIGVVDNAVYRSLRDGVQPTVYAPLAQLRMTPAVISITVRASAGAPGLLARAVAAALTAADHDLALSVRPLSDQVRASLTQERLVAQLSGFLGLLALVLAAVGLYGITAHAVARRRGEIGIRIALGARRAGVISLVLRQTVALTALGILLGLAGAATVTGYIQAQLFGVTPLDVGTFATVGLLFGIVSALAAVVPARHAATVDPLIALRCE